MPSSDHSTEDVTAWASYKIHGLLRFDGEALRVEWLATASLDEVEGMDVRSRVVPLAPEALMVPLEQLRTARVSGWWRPRLEVSANDLGTLSAVPGEDGGRVRFWIRRGDRPLATRVVDAMREAARLRTLGR